MKFRLYRIARLTSSLARAAYWIDRLWQQMQGHQLFAQQLVG